MPKLVGSTVEAIGAALSAHKLLILIVLVAILIVLLLVALIVSRRKAPEAAGASAAPSAPPPAPPVDTYQLRTAWLRFEGGLPGSYRRSILNFEQFVVMGAPASGKSRLIDSYSDWQQQTREFATNQAGDPDLPVYLTSGELIMELPAQVLDDQSETTYQTLNNLWRPIYRERGPTVVAVVDAARLMQAPPHMITDLAQKMRGKINLLSGIRGRAVEVRVALTHLDELEGYAEFADFCRDHEIPLRVPPPPTPEQAAIGRGLDAWFDDLRGYVPNTLISLESAKFRRIVSFLTRAPDVSSAVRAFLKTLFQHEAVAAEPIYGGVYLASETPGVSNPLQGALESGPGPDPRRRHRIAAVVFGVIGVAFLGYGFNVQYARWSDAEQAMEHYDVEREDEAERRHHVVEFTSKKNSWMERHPDFFGTARLEMRKNFSKAIRSEFEKNLRTVAATGDARRSIYYLGLIHSDKDDRLHILRSENTRAWVSMLKPPPGFLSDYLSNVDKPAKQAIQFHLADVDLHDGSHVWVDLLDRVDQALDDGVLTRDELSDLQKSSKSLRGRLEQFEYDSVMRGVLRDIDLAAGTEDRAGGNEDYKDAAPPRPGPVERRESQATGPLGRHYHFVLGPFEQRVDWAKDPDLRQKLERVLDVLDGAAINVTPPHTLKELLFHVKQLYDNAAPTEDSQTTVITIEGKERKLQSGLWAQIIRDSKVEQYVEGLIAGSPDERILFGTQVGSLAPVRWNPNGDGAAVFLGRGVLDGRYTKLAYDSYVGDVVTKLTPLLAQARMNPNTRARFNTVVALEIANYAGRYREAGRGFAQSFDVQAGSQEALRVALAQMSNETSAFNDFLVALDGNTRLEAPVPLLSSIGAEMATFDSWHQAVGGSGGAPEIGKYKAILGQLLVDLGAPAAGGAPEAPPAAAGPPGVDGAPAVGAPQGDTGTETLEKLLTPAGRLYLAELRGEKGSYSVLVENWLTSIRMPPDLRKPFRAPLRRLAELGRHDIERVISRMWQVDMLPGLQRIAVKFPFDRATTVEASPDEIRELFHPKDGRIFDLFRRYVEPLSQISRASGFHPLPAVARNISLPPGLFAAVNASASLSARLWDQTGNPTPIELRISTVKFDRRAQPKEGEPGRGNLLTLMYLNLGEASVFNFNQQPSLVTVGFDWTKDHRSQVGIQLTDTQTKENTFPAPVGARGTYWSFYHLLLRAKLMPVRFPPGALVHTWDVWSQPESGTGEMIPVRFVMVNDPWQPFTGVSHFAPRHRDPPREARRDGRAPPPPPLPPPPLRELSRGTM